MSVYFLVLVVMVWKFLKLEVLVGFVKLNFFLVFKFWKVLEFVKYKKLKEMGFKKLKKIW